MMVKSFSLWNFFLLVLLPSIYSKLVVGAQTYLSCSSDEFACHDGTKCIPTSYLCDLDKDCDDNSDELSPCGATTPPCSSDQFACHDGIKCIPKSEMCNGDNGCVDESGNFASHCNNCTGDHLLLCPYKGVNICVNVKYQCNGKSVCDDKPDELSTQCDECRSSNLFKCQVPRISRQLRGPM